MNLNLISTYLYKYEYDQIHHDSPWSWRWCVPGWHHKIVRVGSRKASTDGAVVVPNMSFCWWWKGKQFNEQNEWTKTNRYSGYPIFLWETNNFNNLTSRMSSKNRWGLSFRIPSFRKSNLQLTCEGDFFLRREDFKRSMEFRKLAVLSLILMNMKSNMVDSQLFLAGKRWTQLLEMDGTKL